MVGVSVRLFSSFLYKCAIWMLLWLSCVWAWNAFIIIKTNKRIWRVITDHEGIFRTLFSKMAAEKITTGILYLSAIFGLKQQLCLCGHRQILLKWGSRRLDWRGGDKITFCQSCQQFFYSVYVVFIYRSDWCLSGWNELFSSAFVRTAVNQQMRFYFSHSRPSLFQELVGNLTTRL